MELAVNGGAPVRGKDDPLPSLFPRDIPGESYELVREVLDSGFTLNMTARFEREFAEACGSKHCVCVCNCTAAVHTALAACGIGAGDEVVVGAISDYGSVAGIIWQGATLVFADVDLATGNMTAETLAAAITPKTKAVVVVHFYGLLCDLAPIVEVAKTYDLITIEDCCQTPLAVYHGKAAGTFGECACFSFDAEKHLSTDTGGAIITDNDEIAERARRFAISRGSVPESGYGRRHIEPGLNYRYSSLLAAVGIAQLKSLPALNERRRQLANLLTQQLSEIEGVYPPPVLPGTEPTWWLYFIRFELSQLRASIDELAAALTAEGLPGGIARYYLIPDSHTFLTNRDLSRLPNAVAHINSVYRWAWTDRYTEQDIADMTEIVRKVVDYYRR